MSSGEFIRALLPFNESTSSGDQAHVNIIVENSGQPSAIPQSLVAKYRPYAISLRSLIRVKMADTEDLKQVLHSFSPVVVKCFITLHVCYCHMHRSLAAHNLQLMLIALFAPSGQASNGAPKEVRR